MRTGHQHRDESKDASKQRKPRKFYICESTEHLKSECPERSKTPASDGTAATETKRKPRGQVTLLQQTSSVMCRQNLHK
ncbi:hypothetical protein GN244_ATG11405 [Phytophthora infestans]|uniref:CCHC-type domain-containing protein n=1 Tax=Phytophthora infestans TaxID=4787 RepID=A0A833WBT2_PHYIN|nr:hypothetical protein GN244_ATG11405 [Phytophthora infestans]